MLWEGCRQSAPGVGYRVATKIDYQTETHTCLSSAWSSERPAGERPAATA
jgi:hypothetical protein